MIAVSVSTRSDQSTFNVPESIQVKSLTTTSLAFSGPKPMRTKTKIDSAAAISSAAQVTICAGRSPMTRENRPAMAADSSGNRTMSLMARSMSGRPSARHRVDVFDLDRSAVAEIDHQNGKADRRLGGGHGQHQHGEDLAHDIALEDREGDEVDVHREQHQLDAHQDDDDVLAVEENAQDPHREQHPADEEVMVKPNGHHHPPPS